MFYIAFPDVAVWAAMGQGRNIVVSKFKKDIKDEPIEGEFCKVLILSEIIKMYLEKESIPFECKKILNSKSCLIF